MSVSKPICKVNHSAVPKTCVVVSLNAVQIRMAPNTVAKPLLMPAYAANSGVMAVNANLRIFAKVNNDADSIVPKQVRRLTL